MPQIDCVLAESGTEVGKCWMPKWPVKKPIHFQSKKRCFPEAKCSHSTSIGSFGASSGPKSIASDPVKPVGPLETRSGAIRGPDFFFTTEIKSRY